MYNSSILDVASLTSYMPFVDIKIRKPYQTRYRRKYSREGSQ